MEQSIDLNFIRPRSVKGFRQLKNEKPYLEIALSGEINEKTKVPMAWIATFLAIFCTSIIGFVVGAVMYVTDIKMSVRILEVQRRNSDANTSEAFSALKKSIEALQSDLKGYISNEKHEARAARAARARN